MNVDLTCLSQNLTEDPEATMAVLMDEPSKNNHLQNLNWDK